MAKSLGISPPALSDIERGLNGPSMTTFRKLVNDYGVNPYFILNGTKPVFLSETIRKLLSVEEAIAKAWLVDASGFKVDATGLNASMSPDSKSLAEAWKEIDVIKRRLGLLSEEAGSPDQPQE